MSDDASVEELLARLKDDGVAPVPALSGIPCIQAWVKYFDIRPGRAAGVTGSVLYKHYRVWCDEQGHKPYTHSRHFLGYLRKKIGLAHGREVVNYRDYRVYLMRQENAKYFREWAKENFRDEDQLSHSKKSNAEIAMEELGVKL